MDSIISNDIDRSFAAGILAELPELAEICAATAEFSVARQKLAIQLASIFDCLAILFAGPAPSDGKAFIPLTIEAANSRGAGSTAPSIFKNPHGDLQVIQLATCFGNRSLEQRTHQSDDCVALLIPSDCGTSIGGIILHTRDEFEASTACMASCALRTLSHLVSRILFDPITAGGDLDARRKLAPRLLQVAQLLADGLSEKQIAMQLDLAPGTIHTYVVQLHRHFDVNNRAELVKKVLMQEQLHS